MRANSSGRLGEVLTKFILTLARNETIKILDISGHLFADAGSIFMNLTIQSSTSNVTLLRMAFDLS
jgi:hypothetical protein